MNSRIQFLKNFLYLKVSSLQNPKNVPPHSSNSCENETALAFWPGSTLQGVSVCAKRISSSLGYATRITNSTFVIS